MLIINCVSHFCDKSLFLTDPWGVESLVWTPQQQCHHVSLCKLEFLSLIITANIFMYTRRQYMFIKWYVTLIEKSSLSLSPLKSPLLGRHLSHIGFSSPKFPKLVLLRCLKHLHHQPSRFDTYPIWIGILGSSLNRVTWFISQVRISSF